MKKIISIVVCVLLLAVFATGCTTTGNPAASASASAPASVSVSESASVPESASASASASAVASKVAGPSFKIGFSYYSFTDQLGAKFKQNLEYAAKAFGCELVTKEWTAVDLEAMTAANDALIQAGCKGIFSVAVTPAMIESCEKAGVYIAQLGSSLDPATAEVAAKSKYFAGSITADDTKTGYEMAKALYDAGSKTICYLAPAPGNASHDSRVKGIEQFANEHSNDFKIVTSLRTNESSKAVDGFRQMLTAYPDIDGVIQTANDGAIIAAIYSDGLQNKVKFAGCDLQADTDIYLKDGTMTMVAGGFEPAASLDFVLLYSAVAGKPLLSGTDATTALLANSIYVKSVDDYNNYKKYVDGSIPVYSDADLQALCPVFNPSATIDNMKKVMSEYNLQSLIEKNAAK